MNVNIELDKGAFKEMLILILLPIVSFSVVYSVGLSPHSSINSYFWVSVFVVTFFALFGLLTAVMATLDVMDLRLTIEDIRIQADPEEIDAFWYGFAKFLAEAIIIAIIIVFIIVSVAIPTLWWIARLLFHIL